MTPASPPPILAAVVTTAPAGRPNAFCEAVRQASGGVAIGFVTVRGPAEPSAGAALLDVYRTRVPLPDATGCSITLPRGRGRGPPVYACSFSGGIDG